MTVTYIKQSSTKGYLRLGISDGDESLSLTVSEREYAEAGSPLSRDSLNEDTVLALRAADERYRAKAKALRVLSYGDNSEGMLMRKLLCAGIRRSIAHEVVCEMVARGYINSRRQLEKLVTFEVNFKNSGPMKLIPKLVAKGYKKSEVEGVISDLEARGEIDFDAARERLLQGVGDDEVKKILYKNGYTVC